MHRLFALLRAWAGQLLGRPGSADPLIGLREEAQQALADWQHAQAHFQVVASPQLVDHAIYQMEEASRRYVCLWSQLRALEAGGTPTVSYGGHTLVDSAQ